MAVFNTRSSHYFLLESYQSCERCNRMTPVFGFALPAGHETLDPVESDDFIIGDGDPGFMGLDPLDFREWLFRPDPQEWQEKDESALVFNIQDLSEPVIQTIQALSAGYRPGQQKNRAPLWLNHCEHCGASLADAVLYKVPGNAFYPADRIAAAGVRVHPVAQSFEAASGHGMIYGSYSDNYHMLEEIDALEQTK